MKINYLQHWLMGTQLENWPWIFAGKEGGGEIQEV